MAITSHAQVDYYKNINDSLRCKQLKTALKTLTSTGYIPRSYDEARFFMEANDTRTSDNGQRTVMWDMYSNIPGGNSPYEFRLAEFCGASSPNTEAVCWNREHCMPASWFSNAASIFTDIVNLVPVDAFINNRRGNVPYGNVNTASFTSLNGSKLGSSAVSGISGAVFEPINAFKGDFARIMLYMITRWEDSIPKWNEQDANRVLGSEIFPGFKPAYIDMLLEWHESDPPSDKEKARNNAIWNFQKNRNPFVDFPEYATRIWKTSEQDCINFTVGITGYSLLKSLPYPNPVTNGLLFLDTHYGGQKYSIMDMRGNTIRSSILNHATIDVSDLSSGLYILLMHGNQTIEYARFSVVQ
jgi:endonuclease I